MKKIISQIVIVVFIITACNKAEKHDEIKAEIIKVEKEFEASVKENGIAHAFYEFADDSA